MSDRVRAKVQKVRLPMYRFYEDPFPPLQRTGSARVYPYPMQDDVTDELVEREFTAVLLNNGLLQVTILPDFGGHILSVRDLKNDREVFYYNLPLKFGLIALRGAWYSGGLEFNFPQVGHTVTTNDPLPWHLTEHDDGSVTVFVGTVERLTRMAWTCGVTLCPNDWRLHTKIWLFNRTPFWHRIYFWTNVGVPARHDFRFLLPCTQVFSWWWGERGIANFPLHEGTDLSLYTTHKRPTDLFAKDLRADWFGCYYEELDYGVLHHADRFAVQGRKLWTWGTAEDGAMWTNLLSDAGEPYCEIQSGRFVHQGVHRLMPPRAVETWTEAWFPVWGLGGVVHASNTVALNASREGNLLTLRLFPLVSIDAAIITITQSGKALERTSTRLVAGQPQELFVTINKEDPVTFTVQRGKQAELAVRLLVSGDKVFADYQNEPAPHIGLPERMSSEPKTVTDWLLRAREHEERNELETAAQCYQQALHLDPNCTAAMNGLAQWHLKRGEQQQGREWAQRALHIDPQNPDALWWLGIACWLGEQQRDVQKAVSSLQALERSPVYAAAASALLGEIALWQKRYDVALHYLAKATERNPNDSKALALAAFAARKLGDSEQARQWLSRCEKVNPLEPLLWSERHFLYGLDKETAPSPPTSPVPCPDEFLWLEIAGDYEQVGAWGTVSVWLSAARRYLDKLSPMVALHLARAMWQMEKIAETFALLREAQQSSPLFAFPSRHEDATALQLALQLVPNDALAHYLLGTLLASLGRWEEGLQHWRQAIRWTNETTLQALAWRNIGLWHWRIRSELSAALEAYDRAVECLKDEGSPLTPYAWRVWLERDHVLAAIGDHERRVALLESAPEPVRQKPQIIARLAEALLRVGKPEGTVALLSETVFKPWEGEVALRQLWKEAHMQLGHQLLRRNEFALARSHFEAAASYPPNLNVGKPHWTDDADALFWAGWCALKMGDKEGARQLLALAANENQMPNARSADFKARALTLLQGL